MAEFWDERDFVSSLPILVDEKRLIEIGDVLVVPGLVVVLVAELGALLVERGLWRHAEVHSLNSVGLLVVPIGRKELENHKVINTYLVTTVHPIMAALIASCQSPPRFSDWSRSVER